MTSFQQYQVQLTANATIFIYHGLHSFFWLFPLGINNQQGKSAFFSHPAGVICVWRSLRASVISPIFASHWDAETPSSTWDTSADVRGKRRCLITDSCAQLSQKSRAERLSIDVCIFIYIFISFLYLCLPFQQSSGDPEHITHITVSEHMKITIRIF